MIDHQSIDNGETLLGVLIILGPPIAFGLITGLAKKRQADGKEIGPLNIIRFLLIPTVGIFFFLFKLMDVSTDTTVLKILETAMTVIVFSLALNILDKLFFSKGNILTKQEALPKLARDVVHILLITLIGALVLSDVWGIHLGHVLTALGFGSLVLGLALQEPLGNLFNGIALLMANPFQKGDWIDIDGEVGKVVEINWRSVKIHTRYNEEIIFPNNLLGKEKIKNHSRPNHIHAVMLTIGFSYDNSPEEVKSMLLAVASSHEQVLKTPTPSALTLEYGDSSISYGLKYFIHDFEDTVTLKDAIMTSIYHAANEKKIAIPYPRQDIHILQRTKPNP